MHHMKLQDPILRHQTTFHSQENALHTISVWIWNNMSSAKMHIGIVVLQQNL